ncbi:MAG: hypothetical protein K6G19_05000 [Lachnospiraceae bacterium]|nr:hypothetical protein [Lachnospiraceae bacterium]
MTERKKKKKINYWIPMFFGMLVISIALGVMLAFSVEKNKDDSVKAAETEEGIRAELAALQTEHDSLVKEYDDLGRNYNGLQAEKDKQARELTEQLEDMTKRVGVAEAKLIGAVSGEEYDVVVNTNAFFPSATGRYDQYCAPGDNYDMRFYRYESVYSSPTDIVMAGDSLIERCEWHEMYPSFTVKNRGIGGDVISGLKARLDQIKRTKPRKLFILIGTNNIIFGQDADLMKIYYGELMHALDDMFDEDECEIYFLSLAPMSQEMNGRFGVSPEYINGEVNGMLEEMCDAYDYTYINIFNALADENGFIEQDNTTDGIHFSAKGYLVVKGCIDPYILEADDEEEETDSEDADDSDDDDDDDGDDDDSDGDGDDDSDGDGDDGGDDDSDGDGDDGGDDDSDGDGDDGGDDDSDEDGDDGDDDDSDEDDDSGDEDSEESEESDSEGEE